MQAAGPGLELRVADPLCVRASSSDRRTGRRDLLLSECNMRKCVVATFVLSEDTCCFESAENSLRIGREAVDAQGCEPDDEAACRTILWPGGPCGQIKITYLTDCDSLSDNVTLICPHRPSRTWQQLPLPPLHGPPRKSNQQPLTVCYRQL